LQSIRFLPLLAITLNAFIVYTSNVFAILGLRAMYFALAGMMDLFHYLHYGLSVVLMFVGVKMLAAHYVHIFYRLGFGNRDRSISVVGPRISVRPKKAAD